jgi:hypothetical protein
MLLPCTIRSTLPAPVQNRPRQSSRNFFGEDKSLERDPLLVRR